VYHYAAYEQSALKRLAMLHGTRESAVDDLLRAGTLVDLYQVVRESIRVSEPSYSIKNLERFYMEERTGDVTDAGASVVVYERCDNSGTLSCSKKSRPTTSLIACRPGNSGTGFCRCDRPVSSGIRVRITGSPSIPCGRRSGSPRNSAHWMCNGGWCWPPRPNNRSGNWSASCWNSTGVRRSRPGGHVPAAAGLRGGIDRGRECIGGLRADPSVAPYAVKKSTVHTFTFPPQDFKMRVGDRPKRAATLEDAGEIVLLDEITGQIALKIGPKASSFAVALSLIPAARLARR